MVPQHVDAPDPAGASCDAQLDLLGGFRLRCRGAPVTAPSSAQRLLALLALRERSVSRSYVAGTLWLDSSERHATGSLRSALWRVRQADPALVEVDGNRLGLGAGVAVDVRGMMAASRQVGQRGGPVAGVDERLFAHDLLPDWYDDWVLLERERLRQVRLIALEQLADRLIDGGDYPGAVRAGMAAVHCELLRESSHRVLIRAHVAEGNYGEALRQYHLYARLLGDELGLRPSPMMEELVAPLMRC